MSNAAEATKTLKSLRDYYSAHANTPSISIVEGIVGAEIDIATGAIRISQEVVEDYPHLAEGYLVEELKHFQQLHERGWLGRALTSTEETALEDEVVEFMLNSGFSIY